MIYIKICLTCQQQERKRNRKIHRDTKRDLNVLLVIKLELEIKDCTNNLNTSNQGTMTILTEFMLYINVIVTMSSVAQNILPLFQNRSYSFKYFNLVFIFSKLF